MPALMCNGGVGFLVCLYSEAEKEKAREGPMETTDGGLGVFFPKLVAHGGIRGRVR